MYSSFLIVILLTLGISETFSYPNNVNAVNGNEEDYNIIIERRGGKLSGNLYFDCKTINIDAGKLFIGDQKDLNLNNLRKRCYGLKQDDENKKCLEYMKNKPSDGPKCPLIPSATESNSINHLPLPETTTTKKPMPTTTKKPQPLTTTTERSRPTTTEKNRPTTRKKPERWTTTTTIPRPTNTEKSEPASSESDEIEYLPFPETTEKPRPTTTNKSQRPCPVPSPGTPCYNPCCAREQTIIVTINNSTGTLNMPGATLNDIKNYYAGRKLGTKHHIISTKAGNVHDVNKL